jgi:hypothetical protein
MNLHALNEIINNHVEILEDTASQTNTDAATIVGIAKFAVSNGYEKLSHNQKYHFDNCIRPLIENIQCSGYNHEFDESPTECYHILDDSDLVDIIERVINIVKVAKHEQIATLIQKKYLCAIKGQLIG